MTKPRNMLLLVQEYGQGGAEKVAYMLADMFRESGYNVTLCSLYAPESPQEGSAVPCRTLGMRPSRSPLQKRFNQAKALFALRRLKKELRTDITISSLWPCDRLNAAIGREHKVAIIQINILNNPQNQWMANNPDKVKAAYSHFDRIVLGGANLWEELTGHFGIAPEKLQVIQNPINSAVIEQHFKESLPPRLEWLLANHRVLVSANRLADIKNTVSLARIAALLPDDKGIRFLIIGEGEEKPGIEAALRDAGLRFANVEDEPFDEDARVYFLRFQKNIHNIISRAAVFLFPTKGEGLPLGLIESMYCALPVVASDCPNGGIFEVMQGAGTYNINEARTVPEQTPGGYLMPVPLNGQTDQMWATAITELLTANPETHKAMGAANRRRALDFDMPATRRQWMTLIDSIFAARTK